MWRKQDMPGEKVIEIKDYIRYWSEGTKDGHEIRIAYGDYYKPKLLNIGQWENLFIGSDIVLLAVGSMVQSAIEVYKLFKRNDQSPTLKILPPFYKQ